MRKWAKIEVLNPILVEGRGRFTPIKHSRISKNGIFHRPELVILKSKSSYKHFPCRRNVMGYSAEVGIRKFIKLRLFNKAKIEN